ncbi:MAG: hypothetical protein ACKVPX_16505 [Myxococcaceae bacterium]
MTATLALLLAGAAGASLSETFLFKWQGTPVGLVQITRTDVAFTYASTHFFARRDTSAARSWERTMSVRADGTRPSDGRTPSALWLWKKPSFGCLEGFDERTDKTGQLCAWQTQAHVHGTMLGKSFRARYGHAGLLEELEVDDARFTRQTTPVVPQGKPALWENGFLVTPGNGALAFLGEPPGVARQAQRSALTGRFENETAPRALAEQVHASFVEASAESDVIDDVGSAAAGACLAHARRFVAWAQRSTDGVRARVVLGVHAGSGAARAFPHAWVEVRTAKGLLALDPTLLVAVTPQTHLALGGVGDVSVGETYMALGSGRSRLGRFDAVERNH